jgi:hypothetical protein
MRGINHVEACFRSGMPGAGRRNTAVQDSAATAPAIFDGLRHPAIMDIRDFCSCATDLS